MVVLRVLPVLPWCCNSLTARTANPPPYRAITSIAITSALRASLTCHHIPISMD